MNKNLVLLFMLNICLLGLYGCSDDEGPEGGKGSMYQVTLRQAGELDGFIKSLVVTANGTRLIHEETGKVYEGTVVLGDDDLTDPVITFTTQGKAIEFAVSGAVVDRDDEIVSGPMTWTVTVAREGKEIDQKTVTFEDGKELSSKDLNLYYK